MTAAAGLLDHPALRSRDILALDVSASALLAATAAVAAVPHAALAGAQGPGEARDDARDLAADLAAAFAMELLPASAAISGRIPATEAASGRIPATDVPAPRDTAEATLTAQALRRRLQGSLGSAVDLELLVADAFPEVSGGLDTISAPVHPLPKRILDVVRYCERRGWLSRLDAALTEAVR
jgi:hypothetical protein